MDHVLEEWSFLALVQVQRLAEEMHRVRTYLQMCTKDTGTGEKMDSAHMPHLSHSQSPLGRVKSTASLTTTQHPRVTHNKAE